MKSGDNIDILIDYLTVSFNHISLEKLLSILNVDRKMFEECGSYFSYQHCMRFSGITIHYNSYKDEYDRDVRKICLDLSGKGCRTVESFNQNIDWQFFILRFMIDESFSVSRIDIACDEKEGILSMDTMFSAVKSGRYICRAQRKPVYAQGGEEWIYFGSPSSERRLRIYNKAMERKVTGHWIRAELQLRDETAQSFINNLFKYGDVGRVYAGVMNEFIRFVTKPYNGSHSARYVTSKFWLDFIQSTEKIKRYLIGGLEYNLENLVEYINQYASSLKTYLTYTNGDVTTLFDKLSQTPLNRKQKEFLFTQQISESEIEDLWSVEKR